MRFSKVLYVALLYSIVVLTFVYPSLTDHYAWLPDLPSWLTSGSALLVWVLSLTLVAVLVVADSVSKAARGETRRLLRGMSWFKFALIPLFVVNFLFFAAIVLGFTLYGVAAALFTLVDFDPKTALAGGALATLSTLATGLVGAIIVGLTYAVMLPTSADGIAFLIMLRRRRQIGIPAFVLHLVLHLMFVADIVSTLILCLTYWKQFASRGDSATARAVEAPA